eukprot:TRINITY_DN470_c0_g1_i1.p1 TRINITY_DN470_c0_g1~~TRINITY_DN470_c0_g1_i1.p1  ORF type:complete len:679 (-),score=192.21 TRINITY_DN470_c0_g1_i1:193-2229(-)
MMMPGASIVDTLFANHSVSSPSGRDFQRNRPLNPGPVVAANVSGGQRSPMGAGGRQAKLFIGGISRNTTTKHLRDHFMKYGRVIDCVAMKEADGRSRGFGYVTFSSQAACDRALSEPQNIDGRIVDVKRAVPEGTDGGRGPEPAFFRGPVATELSMSGSDALWQKCGNPLNPWSWADNSMGVCALDDFTMSALGWRGSRQLDCLELLSSAAGAPLMAPGPLSPTAMASQQLPQQGNVLLGTMPVATVEEDLVTDSHDGKCLSAEANEFVPTLQENKVTPKAVDAGKSKPRKILGELSTENASNILRAASEGEKAEKSKADLNLKGDLAKAPMFIEVERHVESERVSNVLLPTGKPQKVNTLKSSALEIFQDDEEEEEEEKAEEISSPLASQQVPSPVGQLANNANLPSLGSAFHGSGKCKRCNFFAKGRCENGKACEFCHLPHDKRKANRQEKRLRENTAAVLLNIETEHLEEQPVPPCLGTPSSHGFLGLPPVLLSHPSSLSPAYAAGLVSPCFGAGVGVPPAAVAAWQPEQDPLFMNALVDAIAHKALSASAVAAAAAAAAAAPPAVATPSNDTPAAAGSVLSTAPPSTYNPLATPSVTLTAGPVVVEGLKIETKNVEETVAADKAPVVTANVEEDQARPQEEAEGNVWSREEILQIFVAMKAAGAVRDVVKTASQ